MKNRSIIIILTFTFCIITSFVVYGQIPEKISSNENQSKKNNILRFDTTKTAIIGFNKNSKYPFDSTFNAASLTQNELQTVDSFLLVCVTDYNNSLDKDHKEWSIDFKNHNYRKQLIVATNKNGQKEVWVNCFCQVYNDKLKTRVLDVMDGGNCYFNFKINLTTKTYYDLGVNGVA